MNILFRHRRSASRGLTLIELVLVLAIVTWESTSTGTVRFNGGALVNASAVVSRYFVFGLSNSDDNLGPCWQN